MVKTKQKILDAALRLFNEFGYPNIKLRRIALEIGISQGNLNYYFRKREDIVEALYFQLLVKFNEEKARVDESGPEKLTMQQLFDSNLSGMQTLYEYRFLMINLNQVMHENRNIYAHFAALEKVRKDTYLKLFDIAVAANMFRAPEFPGEFENLADRIRIIGDYWIASIDLYGMYQEAGIVEKHHFLMIEMLYPYLTDAGKKAFLKVSAPFG